MPSNLDRYKKDIDSLIDKGGRLYDAIQVECYPTEYRKIAEKHGEAGQKFWKALPSFKEDYQAWYSEARTLVKQLLPDRVADFVAYYEKTKIAEEYYTRDIHNRRLPSGDNSYAKLQRIGP